MHCLGIDIGSTSIKGAVLGLESGAIGTQLREPFPAPISGLPAGHFEIDPRQVLSATQSVIDGLLEATPTAEAIFFSGQMGGVILVDQSSNALSNYLSWRDQRTLQVLDPTSVDHLHMLRLKWRDVRLPELGLELQAGSASSLMYWLAQHDQLPDWAIPATIADYVIGQLTQSTPQMDLTHAIGLLNLKTGSWHHEAFAEIQLDRVRWPQLANYRIPVGSYVFRGRQIPCYASFGDQQCALRGVGLTRDELSLNISTGSQVSQRTATFQPGEYQSRMYFDGDYLNTITHLPAGRSLNVLVDLLTELSRAEGITLTRPWETIARSATNADGGNLKVNLAFFGGPMGTAGRINAITTENLTVGNLFFAAFENMADNYLTCADRLTPDRSRLSIALSGGLTRSVPVLRQLIENRFGTSLRESTEAEETLMGLLQIAREVLK